jgi:hypothetical protein
MALVKKGSRLITVDGALYRWRVRKRPSYAQALAQSPLSFAVERADRGGAVLIVTMPGAHPGAWVGGAAASVVPSLVAAAIRRGRERGWAAERPGSAFFLTLDEEIGAAR